MAPRSARAEVGSLARRVVSAAVLAPPVLLAVYLGSPFVEVLVVAAGGLMTGEAARAAFAGPPTWRAAALAAAVAAGVLLGGVRAYEAAGVVAVAAGALAFVMAPGPRAAVLAAAIGYIAAACLAFLWLRGLADVGLAVVAWLIAGVWAADIGAFALGRTVGGARLAPRVSPGKTWAGLLGGMALAAAASTGCGLAWPAVRAGLSLSHPAALAGAGAALAIVAQGGDLLESAFKRYFGIKDTGRIIPGHGGVLDRADGLLAASLFLAAVMLARQGA